MAGMSLIQGGDNPIFQASQKIAEQEASRKDMAIQGIINQNIQVKAKQLGAELESANAMMQSKNWRNVEAGARKHAELTGQPITRVTEQNFQEIADAAKAHAEVMGNRAILPQAKLESANRFNTLLGGMYGGFEGDIKQIEQERVVEQRGILGKAATEQGAFPKSVAEKLSLAGEEGASALGAGIKSKAEIKFKEETPSAKDTTSELTARNYIKGLVNSKLASLYGSKGAIYNAIDDSWKVPPGFNQNAFSADYDRLTSEYNKAYGLKDLAIGNQAEADKDAALLKKLNVSTQTTQKNAMDALPSPAEHIGKTIRDTKTNERLFSNGKTWVKIK